MPSTVVHAGFALLLAAALLDEEYGRPALAAVLVVLVLPELDTAAGLAIDGAHRALFHTLLLPLGAAALLYYDVRIREASWLRCRVDDGWIRVAWILLAVHVFAHLLLDYAHLEGINVFYPLYDRFFRLEGELYLSTTEGLVQTFVDVTLDRATGDASVDAGAVGTTEDTHVANPIVPTADPDPGDPVDRRFPIAVRGWQLYLVLVGLFTLVARRLQARAPGQGSERRAER